MSSASEIRGFENYRRILRVQAITIVWMTVEAAVSILAAWKARSPALLAFGGDSAIELLSAAVVMWRFRTRNPKQNLEKRASRIAGALLFLLAGFVVVLAIVALFGYSEPRPTLLGIAILMAAIVIMPWLTAEKLALSAATGSAALRADAAQSGLCAYLSIIVLVGLALNGLWHLKWADPVAALAITPLILWEGAKAWRGNPCACC
jgi:divalent metal cation (Fe/Co/Zn/Cd) transporter